MQKKFVPDVIFTLLNWIIGGKLAKTMYIVNKDHVKENNKTPHRHISLDQCKNAPVTGSEYVHRMTQSKEVARLLNKHRHCISSDDICRIDTSWAEEQFKTNLYITVNMISGRVSCAAEDDFSRAAES